MIDMAVWAGWPYWQRYGGTTMRSATVAHNGTTSTGGMLASTLKSNKAAILAKWVSMQTTSGAFAAGTVTREEVARTADELLSALIDGLAKSDGVVAGGALDELNGLLAEMSLDRARQGFSPTETATAVFRLKAAVLPVLQAGYPEPARLFAATTTFNDVVDQMGLTTFEHFVRGREAMVSEQSAQLLELSTPVVKLWDGIVAMPLIGTLDSGRTQVVMETLLDAIVSTGASIAILDITGVATVDTMVAQHLLKTVAAARLMGAECIISGIRPSIAQTVVHLGLGLANVTTKASLSDALALSVERLGYRVARG